jgi:hypothetical protein
MGDKPASIFSLLLSFDHLIEERNKAKVKVKVKLALCVTKHHAMMMCWGNGGIAPYVLNLGTKWR